MEYPAYPFRWRTADGKRQIFDVTRKKWVLFTPEEWVRQNFLQYLLQVKNYPASMIAVERVLQLGELSKRFDILVYNSEHKPWLMVECKAMEVPLKDEVLHQVLRYNIAIPVHYLVITNGTAAYFFQRKEGKLTELESLPGWGKE